jgi:outer membrane immunogenic protein
MLAVMKKLTFCIVTVAALIGTPAFAADMAVKAPPPAPAPVYNWTGFYVGGNVGYSWGKAVTDGQVSGWTFSPGSIPNSIPGSAFSDSNRLNGIIGGGQVGYNWQSGGPWVYGLELDWQASAENGGATHSATFAEQNGPDCPSGTCEFVNGTGSTHYEAKILWFGTARGRVGYASDGWLLYATGGLAYGRVRLAGTDTVAGTVTDCDAVSCASAFFNGAGSFSQSRINAGWTVGGGVEGALTRLRNWTWKVEYLYLDLGSLDASGVTSGNTIAAGPFVGPTISTHTHFTDNIIRLGLNYQFH